jgi:hypothetical protein
MSQYDLAIEALERAPLRDAVVDGATNLERRITSRQRKVDFIV